MRALILTGRFGMGHIAAAQALQEEILREDPTTDVTVLDVIETCLPQLRHLIYGCFDFTVNYCSGVYNVLNRVAGRYPRAPMRRADLLLTKAGGMTAFEAIHTGTPLCLLDPFLMQEEANAAYIEREGFGIVLRDKETAIQQMLALLRNRDMLNDMRQRMAVTLRSLDQISALDKFWERRQAAC